jgi:hypothetical protein
VGMVDYVSPVNVVDTVRVVGRARTYRHSRFNLNYYRLATLGNTAVLYSFYALMVVVYSWRPASGNHGGETSFMAI